VAKALLGRDAVPDDLPFVTGPIGLLGSRPSYDMVMGCDALFMIGTSFPYAEWLPPEGQAKGVEIDIDGRMIGIRYPMDVHLVGDSKDTLQALVPLLERKTDRSWREEIEGNITQWWKVLEDRAMMDGDPMNPQRVAHELSSRLPERCIITADSGSATTWWARHLRLRRGMKASLSGTLATMGPGVPYAIGAKFAYPDRPVIAMVGDGAFQMNGMNEMITVKRYWERWSNPTLIFCVFNNGDLNQVSWEQRAMAGSPRFPTSQALPDVPYAEYAALLGLKGIRCEKGEEMGAAWDEALAARRPVVLEVVVDDEIPPLPPKIRKSEAKQLMLALAKGDTERAGVIEKGFLQKFYEFKEALSSSED
jgi:pyruvate dehydrogenase (quinone)